jgi:hypothetical protein
LTPAQRTAVLQFCSKEGFLDAVKPKHKTYEYAVVLGATVPRMQKRLAYLQKLYDSGVRFKQVVLLTGARPLDPAVETSPEGATEGEAMAYLWKSMELSKKVPWKQVDTPMIAVANGRERRPSRADTLRAWRSTSPVPGPTLLITNQPYCPYEQAVAEHILCKGFKPEAVGAKADVASLNGRVLLDNIARWIYESNKR